MTLTPAGYAGQRRLTRSLAITSLACAMAQLPLEVISLGVLWLLGPGVQIRGGVFGLLETGLFAVLAIVFGAVGQARIGVAGRGRRLATAG